LTVEGLGLTENKAQEPQGPDLELGIDLESLLENSPLLGHVDGEPVILVRQAENVFAIGATCTHYGGPLAEGLVVGETIRCPWHHARFSLLTGEAEGAPALNPVACFGVKREGGRIRVDRKRDVNFETACPQSPDSVVIIGAGASGAACVDMLRQKGYHRPITLIGNEEPGPVDRPNLSKDYLAGKAPEDWIALRTREYYESIHVELVTTDPAIRIDPVAHQATLRNGRVLPYGTLLLATGAEAKSIPIEGASLPHVHRLRTLADSRAIIAGAQRAKRCVVIGSSFIGLEVAASLRERGLEVAVVGKDAVPLEKALGPEFGKFIKDLHEQHGVRFYLGSTPQAIRQDRVELSNGQTIEAEMVVLGVGVLPRTALAEDAGIAVDNGILVNDALRTSAPDIYASGDVARYPDPISGENVRIEHWVLAERQGQAIARTMLGLGHAFRDVPFFWSQHYEVQISYVGHASSWDGFQIIGDLTKGNVCGVYRKGSRVLAVATIGRDRVSLQAEAALERNDLMGLEFVLNRQQ
jgi:NADPH-dependent 2,4-dienoyl-CoA reductase/sulfur reductase-like enzyme/nitrite reductase/ring-hydroxylating ferredoxin subunit